MCNLLKDYSNPYFRGGNPVNVELPRCVTEVLMSSSSRQSADAIYDLYRFNFNRLIAEGICPTPETGEEILLIDIFVYVACFRALETKV